MAELLNLDELLPEEKFVKLDGERHLITVQSVESWLQLMKKRSRIEKLAGEGGEDVPEENIPELVELQVEIAQIALPSIPEEKLRKLPMPLMMRLIEVIGNEMAPDGAAARDGGEDSQGEAPGEAAEES